MEDFLTADNGHPRTVFIGIDNGPSGSIGIQVYNHKGFGIGSLFMKTPTYMRQDYTKKKKRISQLDLKALKKIFRAIKNDNVYSAMERPLVNPGRWNASIVGVRVHQQWLDLFDFFHLPEPISLDSREWQKTMLPKGTTGEELKVRSKEIGLRLFPKACSSVKNKDYDGMFICEWIRRKQMLK